MKKINAKKIIAAVLTLVFLLSIGFSAYAAEGGVPTRADIKDQYKWKLEHIYATKDAFEKDYAKVQKQLIPAITKFKGKISSPQALLNCLKAYEDLNRTMDKLYVYAYMKLDENNADNAASEQASRVEALQTSVGEAGSFIQPEILTKPEATLKKDYVNNPLLKDYKYYLTVLLNKKAHILPNDQEQILAMAGDIAGSPDSIYGKLVDVDMDFPSMKDAEGNEVKLTYGQFSVLRGDKNRDIRKEACEKHLTSYLKMQNTLAETLNAEVKKNIFFAKARKYDSALQAAVEGNNNIPVSVYDNLVKAVDGNVNYLHKYITLKKNVLGVDKVHYYDLYASLVDNFDMNIPYEDAKKMVLAGLKPLGPQYIKDLQMAFDSNWIDVYETQNKTTGGYQWGSYDTHPYVLLNYDNSLGEVSTIAHELGHAMNSYYTNRTQKYINSNYATFTAEVASTTNEMIMMQYLIDNAKSKEEKLYLLNTQAENIRSTIYSQIMYAEFEKAIHERVENGEALSAETLKSMWKELMEKYFGPDFQSDEYATMWWSYIPHFYMDFYVYNYATSMSAAYPLSQGLVKGDKGAQEKYLTFLAAGGSDSPITLLKNAGVDMNSTKPVDDILKYFNSLVDQMEQILKEQGKIK